MTGTITAQTQTQQETKPIMCLKNECKHKEKSILGRCKTKSSESNFEMY